jgi:hypothetical protein
LTWGLGLATRSKQKYIYALHCVTIFYFIVARFNIEIRQKGWPRPTKSWLQPVGVVEAKVVAISKKLIWQFGKTNPCRKQFKC